MKITSDIVNGNSNLSKLNDGRKRYWNWYWNRDSSDSRGWCAVYASYLVSMAGVDGLKSASQVTLYKALDTKGCFIKTSSDPNYKPKTGDLIFLDYEHNGEPDHVAMIVIVNGETKVLHGNWSSKVSLTTTHTSTGTSGGRIDQCIFGYGDVSKFASLG